MKIEEAIKQKAFPSAVQKANINLLYTQAWVQSKIAQELKHFKISPQQFNILRILRGQHPKPASIKELTSRMIDKASNASRLVDKLLNKGLVSKKPCKMDNRRMEVVITDLGLEMLEEASKSVEICIEETYDKLTEKEAVLLNEILNKIHS